MGDPCFPVNKNNGIKNLEKETKKQDYIPNNKRGEI